MKNQKNNSDIHIETTIEVHHSNKAAQIGGSFFVMLLLLFLGAAGSAFAWPSIFDFSCDVPMLLRGILLYSLLFAIIFSLRSWVKRGILLSLSTLLFALFCIRRIPDILSGFRTVAESVLQQINAYYKVNFLLNLDFVEKGSQVQTTLFLLAFLYVITGFLACAIFRRLGSATVFLWCMLPFASALLVGKVPSFYSMLSVIFCFLGTTGLASSKAKRVNPIQVQIGICLLALLGAATLTAALLIQPPLEKAFPRILPLRQKITAFVNQDLWSKISRIDEWLPIGSRNRLNGQLGSSRGFSYTGARALTVTTNVKPEGSLYLRAFIGGNYTGKEWEPVSAQSFHHLLDEQDFTDEEEAKISIQNQLFRSAEFLYTGNGAQDSGLRQIRIKKITADSTYAYLPYAAQVDSRFSIEGDGAVTAPGLKEITVPYYPLENFFPNSQSRLYFTDMDSDNISAYSSYPGREYVSYPEEQLANLKQLCDTLDPDGIQEARDMIISAIQSRAVYNLNTGACPAGKEFTEHFLFEEKEGYCIHFATTAALMFRMKNIPSRYVAGYIAPPSLFQDNGDGTYTAEVKDEKAHAWAEIYIDGFGWIPVEATPAYNQTAGQERPSDETASGQEETPAPSPQEPTQTPEETPLDQDAPSVTPGKASSPAQRFLPLGVFLPILLLALLAMAACCWRLVMLSRQRRSFTSADYSANVRRIFRSWYDLLIFSGKIPRGTKADDSLTETVAPRLPFLDRGELDGFWDLALMANYGSKPLTAKDSLKALDLYKKTCREVYRQLPAGKKLIYHFLFQYIDKKSHGNTVEKIHK